MGVGRPPEDPQVQRARGQRRPSPTPEGRAGEVRSLEVTSSPWRSALGSRPPASVSHFYHGSCVSKPLETGPQAPEPVYPGGWLTGQDSGWTGASRDPKLI